MNGCLGDRNTERPRVTILYMQTKSLNHSVYRHEYHIVWNTKYRYKILKPYVSARLQDSLFETARQHPEIYIVRMNTDNDHVHLVVEIAPSVSVAAAVGRLKANASKDLKRAFKFLKKIYLDQGIWSVGYFSSTVGLDEAMIIKYVSYQGQRDKPSPQQGFDFA